MASRFARQEFLEQLSDVSREALVSIYNHRCLTESLLCRYFFEKDAETQDKAHEQVAELVELGCIAPMDYDREEPAFFLTELGISVVRQTLIYPDRKDLTAAQLKMQKFLIPHQMSLNAVGLEMEEIAKSRNIPYEYYDCKFMTGGTTQIEVMPDGMFRFNGYDIFLEMDMNSEASDELLKKWNNYSSWMGTSDFIYKEHKTIVLFLLCNVKRTEIRKATVLKSISKGLLDKISPKFDIFVDAPEILEDLLFNWILDPEQMQKEILPALRSLQKLGFSTALATSFNHYINGNEYGFYTRMLSPKTHKIEVKGGRAQEFLSDIITGQTPASVINKAVFLNSSMIPLRAKVGREIPYLIIGEDQKTLIADLKATGAWGLKNVYLTTKSRLESCVILPEAIFQIDQLGRCYHFSDFGLQEPVFEANL